MVENKESPQNTVTNTSYVTLNNGYKMPIIGFGTWRILESKPIIQAIELGYRSIDTASFYKNEEFVG